MNLCFLAAAGSVHTQRIVASLAARGHRLTVMTFHPGDCPGATVVPIGKPVAALGRLNYLLAVPRLRRMLAELRPDILHAHYLPSYGLAASLSGCRPFLLSVWGTDVFSFPRSSPGAALVARWVLSRADTVMATSRIMARETNRYTGREVRHTPFGIDCDRFFPAPGVPVPGEIIIGTVKALEPQYGLEHLIRAVSILIERFPALPLTLELVGRGGLHGGLRALAESLGIGARVRFPGYVPQAELPDRYRRFSVAAFPSVCQESFGVALLEAQACGVPVVASRVGGFPETVDDGRTGLLVPPGDPIALADAIGTLLVDDARRREMAAEARAFVLEHYQWHSTIDLFERIYAEAITLLTIHNHATGCR